MGQGSEGVSIREAAAELEMHDSTVRRWVARGAPCIRPGRPGRGNGARLDLVELRRWRAQRYGIPDAGRAHVLEGVAKGLWDLFMRDCSEDCSPAHEYLGIPGDRAAVLLVLA